MKNQKSIDITKLTEKYGPGYVARDKKTGKIIAYASKVNVLFKKMEAKNLESKKFVISWIPKRGARYVFSVSLRIR